ncbi:hypothetical protein BCEP4_600022 [Burkholderia cepacia]|nr:hypothetical protein BCEP4_600022 [Burkholderia cepacia]
MPQQMVRPFHTLGELRQGGFLRLTVHLYGITAHLQHARA